MRELPSIFTGATYYPVFADYRDVVDHDLHVPINPQLVCHDCHSIIDSGYMMWCIKDSCFGQNRPLHYTMFYCESCLVKRLKKFLLLHPSDPYPIILEVSAINPFSEAWKLLLHKVTNRVLRFYKTIFKKEKPDGLFKDEDCAEECA